MKNRISKISKLTGLVILAALGVVSASAEVVTFDADLASPDTAPADNVSNLSWYNGSGNQGVQGGWTVVTGNDLTSDTSSSIELGLRAHLRQDPNIITPTGSTYIVPTGTQTDPPADSNNPARDAWNYEFSIDLNPGGDTTSLTFNQVTAVLTITDLTNPNTVSFDPTLPSDDSGFGSPATAGGPTMGNLTVGVTGTEWGAQNSENPLFGGLPAWYNPNSADTYQVELDVYNGAGLTPAEENAGNLIASDSIDIEAVAPEPSTFALVGIGLLALFFTSRRRRSA